MVFKSISDLKRRTQIACNIAVENACDKLLKELQKIITTEYYNQYNPKEYIRTMQFLHSAMTKMLSQNVGVIYMDASAMDYKEWTGELQLIYASQGYHGSLEIQTDGRFWDTFTEFCKNNVRQILREELIKQGIPIIN